MEGDRHAFKALKAIDESALRKLSENRICFGHQSVGFNILEGVKDIMRDNPKVKLKIIETQNREDYQSPVLGHFKVGKNEDAKSKCDHFVQTVEQKIGSKADIAFFKFCFVDVTASSNVMEVFSYYRDSMAYLKKKYPKVTFVHVTVPLTTVQTGWKVPVKRLLRKPIDGYDDNVRRNEFNDLLRKEYLGKEPLFDLAEIESTYLDGKRSSFEMGGKLYHSLIEQYTDDGGHLNKEGRKITAEQLLVQLVNLAK